MKIGIVFPQTEFGNNVSAIRDYTQMVEELGFSHILAYEHVLGANPDRPGGWRGPYTHEHPFHEPFVLFGYMAALTTTLQFATGILVLPQRKATVVAKQAAQLDVLSGGRFRLGIGVGWNKVEMAGMDENPANRGARADEQLEVMRQLWSQPLVKFSGKYHELNDVGINPMPVQQPFPVWVGGHAEANMRRIAKFGHGWMPGFREAADAQAWLDQLDGYLEAEGRSRADIGIEPRINYKGGSPESWGATLEGWRASGGTHASVNTMGCGFLTPKEHMDALRKFAGGMF